MPGASVKAIAHRLGTETNTVSTLVPKLTAAGLVTRKPLQNDLRIAQLSLTPQGQALVVARRQEPKPLRDLLSQTAQHDQELLTMALPVLHQCTDELIRHADRHRPTRM